MTTKTIRKYIRTRNHITTIIANHFLILSGYRNVENVHFEIFEDFAVSPQEPLYFKLLEEFARLGLKEGTDYIIQDRTTHNGLWFFKANTIKAVYTANRVLEMNSRLIVDENFRIELHKEYQFPADSELFGLFMEAFYNNCYIEQEDYTYVAMEFLGHQRF